MTMTIGRITWDSCEKCVHFDDEMGCRQIDDLEIVEENGMVVCITGEESDGLDVPDWEPWE